jgi:hypothetical protein
LGMLGMLGISSLLIIFSKIFSSFSSRKILSQVRLEGTQPDEDDLDAIPLFLYYSADNTDNYVTTSHIIPDGYTRGMTNGYLYKTFFAGAVEVQIYYNTE